MCGALNQGFPFSPLQCRQGRARMGGGGCKCTLRVGVVLCIVFVTMLPVRAVRRSASTPPILVSRTTSLSPWGTLFPAACAESITGLLSDNTHVLASALYYPHTPQLRSTRYILPHAVRHLPCPNSPRARALLKYTSYNFLLEDPAKPNLFSS